MNFVTKSSQALRVASLSSLTIAVTLLGSLIAIAPAQAGRCPHGMYPIGGGNAGWEGCAPIPGAEPAPSGPTGEWVSSYSALVWAETQNGVPSFTWAAKYGSEFEAQRAAMQECVSANFKNCRHANSFANGYLVVVKDKKGSLYQASAATQPRAKREARKICKSHKGEDCKVEKVVESKAWFRRY